MLQNLSKYSFGVTRINDHILISIVPIDEKAVDDTTPFPVYCIRMQDEEAMTDCLANAKSMDAVLAFLEVKSYEPKMSKMEADIITFWSDLFDKKHKK